MAWAEVAVAATERTLGRIVLAACALPGVLAASVALADEAPDKTTLAFKLSGYTEWQGNPKAGEAAEGAASGTRAQSAKVSANDAASISAASGGGSASTSGASSKVSRVDVITPSVYAMVPLGRAWSIEGSGTIDQVSGASPTYYSDPEGFAKFKDQRRAVDAKLTRYFHRQTLALGGATSSEADYRSRSLSLDGRWSTDDQNTTWNAGLGITRDTINPSTKLVVNARKSVDEFQLGVTQALSRNDLVQVGYTHIAQRGYLNDPYKLWDQRPDTRRAHVLQLRWNHGLGDAAVKTGYRWFRDDWGVRAHTFDLALVLPWDDFTFTPQARWTTQSAADFYVPADASSPNYPQPANTSGHTTLDQRLSAFGAITVGGRVDWVLGDGWSVNFKADYYRQSPDYRLLENGSRGIDDLSAAIWQLGVQRSF
jgi:Protein of unknown function (DUF3570)